MKSPHEHLSQRLPDEEWSFHKIPTAELRIAWEWELDRTFGNRVKPWLLLNDSERDNACAASELKYDAAIEEYGIECANALFVERFTKFFHGVPNKRLHQQQLHFLRIDWGNSKTKILRELTEWMERHWAAVPQARNIDKGGRKNQCIAWFTDLAIYRASEAGISRSDAIKQMGLLFVACPTKTSASHWEDAQRRTKARLENWQRVVERREYVTKLMRYINERHASGATLEEIVAICMFANPIAEPDSLQ